MEFNAPKVPFRSFKDFFIHISIVTCGILIALGLEGIRESVHNRHLVNETRANVRFEMALNLDHTKDELARVSMYSRQLKFLAADLPRLAQQHPEQINQRLSGIDNPGYFFLTNSWQSALSTGALEHMSTDEVNAHVSATEVIRIYTGLQKDAETHPTPTPDQLEQGTEHLLLFSRAEEALAFVGPQMKASVDRALRAASDH
jgi:hypothetical protein